jgi:hypothetical protein
MRRIWLEFVPETRYTSIAFAGEGTVYRVTVVLGRLEVALVAAGSA